LKPKINLIISRGAIIAGLIVLWFKIKPTLDILRGKKMPKEKQRRRPLGI
jgi:hypothetical protein